MFGTRRNLAQLRDILEELPQPDREILTLRYGLDYNANEIADLLAINATAVHMRLSRGDNGWPTPRRPRVFITNHEVHDAERR